MIKNYLFAMVCFSLFSCASVQKGGGSNFNYAKSFGATGNGKTDDLLALQSAIDASVGKTLIIDQGTYSISNGLILKSNVNIIAFGAEIKLSKKTKFGGVIRLFKINNSSWKGGTINGNRIEGQNGFGISECSNIRITDVNISNCRRSTKILGGRAVTVHPGSKNVIVTNLIIKDCSIGLDVQAFPKKPSTNILFSNCILENVDYQGINCYQQFSPPSQSTSTMNAQFSNIILNNCGTKIAPITFDRSVGIQLNSITINNDRTHNVKSIFRGISYKTAINNIYVNCFNLNHIFDFERVPNGGLANAQGIVAKNIFVFYEKSNQKQLVAADSPLRLKKSSIDFHLEGAVEHKGKVSDIKQKSVQIKVQQIKN